MHCVLTDWFRLDNHFALDQHAISSDSMKAFFDANNVKYHIFGDGSAGSMTNMYACDPTGECVQLDGQWTVTPTGGTGDSLMSACVQGVCYPKEVDSCEAATTRLCPGLGQLNNVCTDCYYTHWKELSAAGCTNADAVVYCTNSSLTCTDKCDTSGECGSPTGAKCSDLVKTYSCDKYYCANCTWAGWCDKECGFKTCQKQVHTL
jgi:hypothetical protein